MTTPLSSQWSRLLRNCGIWQGSFTRLAPDGTVQEDTPTVVSLESLNEQQTMRQTLQYFSPQTGALTQEKVLEYDSLGRGVLFFEDGAFSQGSLQFAPFSDFGAELGLIQGDRRLRLVQLFQYNRLDSTSALSQITLIREYRQHTVSAPQSALTVDQLVGLWQGTAVTLYADWQPADSYSTQLQVWQEGDRLYQRLTAPMMEITSAATIMGQRLLFEQSGYPIQVLLLPGGASSNTPLTIPRGRPFFLEAGWLIHPNLRQRIIRHYDERGSWNRLTLVTEQRQTTA